MANRPAETYTMEDFIAIGRGVDMSYDKYAFKELLENGTEICIHNSVNDYMREMKERAVVIKFTREQYIRYRYHVKLLSYDVYGTQELYFIILLLNGIIDVKEFDFSTLLMLRVDDMMDIMSRIYNAEYKYIDQYNGEHGTM